MTKKFHFALALAILCFYIYALINAHTLFPGLFIALHASGMGPGDPQVGVLFAILLPIFSILCFMFPDTLNNTFSPKTSFLGVPIFPAGTWYVLGYVALALSTVLSLLFV